VKYVLIVLFLTLLSCKGPLTNINIKDFPVSKGTSLAFDLEESKNIQAAIIISGSDKIHEQSFVLPFKSLRFSNNLDLLSTVGDYNNFTYVRFISNSSAPGKVDAIYFSPSVTEYEYAENYNKEINQGVYLIKNGLDRQFVYDYDYFKNNCLEIKGRIVKLDSLDLIAIKVPNKSKGTEIENGKTTIPDCLLSKDKIKLFPGTYSAKLKVGYSLDTDITTNKWMYLIAKVILLLFVPIIEIFFIMGFVQTPNAKKISVSIGILIEILVTISIIVIGLTGHFISFDKLSDAITASAIGIFAILLIYLKDKYPKPSKA
jgi:hypothetical protein